MEVGLTMLGVGWFLYPLCFGWRHWEISSSLDGEWLNHVTMRKELVPSRKKTSSYALCLLTLFTYNHGFRIRENNSKEGPTIWSYLCFYVVPSASVIFNIAVFGDYSSQNVKVNVIRWKNYYTIFFYLNVSEDTDLEMHLWECNWFP